MNSVSEVGMLFRPEQPHFRRGTLSRQRANPCTGCARRARGLGPRCASSSPARVSLTGAVHTAVEPPHKPLGAAPAARSILEHFESAY